MANQKPPTKQSSKVSVKDIDFQTSIRKFFIAMGEDPDRSEIVDTPKRFEKTMRYLLSGYDRNFEEENKLFENKANYKDMIVLRNIDFFSLCEHHLLPFFGYAHVGYIPSEERYLGISKLARVVEIYARRLQTQENIGFQVAEALMKHGKAKGVAILIEGKHLCSVARGVEKKAMVMTTCAYYGSFENDVKLQQSFMEFVREREKI